MLPGLVDGMFDLVVFRTDTECSGILSQVDGLDELGTAKHSFWRQKDILSELRYFQ